MLPLGLLLVSIINWFFDDENRYQLHVSSASTKVLVTAESDPWLAGMPTKSTANKCEFPKFDISSISESPKNSPIEVEGISFRPSSYLTFATKGKVHTRWDQPFLNDADGNQSKVKETPKGRGNNGISSIEAPNGALVGVFIGEDPQNKSQQPNALSFKKPEERNYLELSPKLNQVFFIGNGKAKMDIKQKVYVPRGAKHLYLGIMDWCNWDDNEGHFDVEVTSH